METTTCRSLALGRQTHGHPGRWCQGLPVLISGDGGTKLLGVPQLPPSEPLQVGEHTAAAAVGLVKEWAAEDSIVAMCFDITAANSGIGPLLVIISR